MVEGSRSEHHQNRKILLDQWLQENVVRIPENATLEVAAVDIDGTRYPRELCGQIIILHDGVPLKPWRFSVEITGRTAVAPPYHTSPLGVPASFPMYDVSSQLLDRIAKDVEQGLPSIRGLRQEDSGHLITERVDPSFDLPAWERSQGLQISSPHVPRTSLDSTTWKAPASTASALPTPAPQQTKPSFAWIGFLILLAPLLLVFLLVVTPMLMLFGALGLIDRKAVRLGGHRYLNLRDRTTDWVVRVFTVLAVGSFALLLLAKCTQRTEVDCDWDRTGSTCYPA
ncbi:MAG: hypothetical protein ABIQ32_07365 [Sphingomicrobium sp.]